MRPTILIVNDKMKMILLQLSLVNFLWIFCVKKWGCEFGLKVRAAKLKG